jgi:Na+-transporting NADH:ubiquinone oxidoreductase subunit NqrB
MREMLVIGAALLISLVGFALLALSQERHWTHVTEMGEAQRAPSWLLHAFGLSAQACALPPIIWAEGSGFGCLLWGVGLTGSATTVALALTWFPGALMPIATLLTRRTDRPGHETR